MAVGNVSGSESVREDAGVSQLRVAYANSVADDEVLADENRRRQLDEGTRSISPGIDFSSDGNPIVRIYVDVDLRNAQPVVDALWPGAELAASRYTQEDLVSVRSGVERLILNGDEALGADYDRVDDVFRITGNALADVITEELQGHVYEFIAGEARRV